MFSCSVVVPLLKRLLVNLLILIWTVPILISLIILLIFSIPFLIYWQLNQLSAKLLRIRPSRANLSHIIKPLAQLMANDDIHGKPTLNICFCAMVEGKLLPEGCQQRFQEGVLTKKEYQELTHYITKFGGYYYWEKDVHFNLKNHIRVYDYGDVQTVDKQTKTKIDIDLDSEDGLTAPSPCTETDLKRILGNLVLVPWKRKQSPWEVLIIRNFKDRASELAADAKEDENLGEAIEENEKSLIIFRIHHVLADGYSLQKVLKQALTGAVVPSASPGKLKKSIKTTPLIFPIKCLWNYSRFLWELYSLRSTNSQGRSNPWKMPLDLKTLKYNLTWSNGIPVQTVKELKRKFGVSFQAVLVSIIAGAVRKLQEQAGQNIMEEILNFLTFPLPNHPGGLNNHFGINLQKLPLGEKNPVRRLSICAAEIKRVKRSTAPYFLFWNLRLLGHFPSFLATRMAKTERHKVTLCIAPFPGPSDESFLDGHKLTVPTIFTNGFDRSDTGALITSLSMFGEMRIVLSIRKELYPSVEMLDKFAGFIQEELELLASLPADSPSEKCPSSSSCAKV